MDEALGRPFQDTIVTAVNSFFKQPLVEVEVREGDANDHQQEDEAMAEEEEMDEDEESSQRP